MSTMTGTVASLGGLKLLLGGKSICSFGRAAFVLQDGATAYGSGPDISMTCEGQGVEGPLKACDMVEATTAKCCCHRKG